MCVSRWVSESDSVDSATFQFSEGFKPTLSGRVYDSLKKEPSHNSHLFVNHTKQMNTNILFMNMTLHYMALHLLRCMLFLHRELKTLAQSRFRGVKFSFCQGFPGKIGIQGAKHHVMCGRFNPWTWKTTLSNGVKVALCVSRAQMLFQVPKFGTDWLNAN